MKRSMTLTATILATLLAGGSALAATSKSQPAPKSERHDSKRKKRVEKREKRERAEKGERGEGVEKAEGGSRNQAALEREARITMNQARTTALRRASGNVESGELEREHGQLVYSFDIRNARGTITEVQVNAMTGKIARIQHENKKKEASEKQKEMGSK